ncbi:DNA repair exonuclease SbcCD ATPase subunit [Anaerobacterium chartisolvens]|uniref:DNA repair exonuclease SbcCD ATPase subunit n=1 Tax=Anaerobacterium chartisolvens TaxID=1297424 RepID=A0A369B3P7_9FIRM|nr:AAA family ATPase [Anaerobacterium chartisolvens]RCX16071.1 DNA repair exonuclease SbcCD ATPase subunit [Anaerobacterium chartisolvens]
MRIEKLEIKGFGKLRNRKLELKPGLNIVFGANESGKTSLQCFIRSMLFGIKGGKGARDGTPSPLKMYRPWDTNEFSGIMEYVLDNGERYRIERSFVNNSVRIFDSFFNNITDTFHVGKDKRARFAEKHTGMNEVCFSKTVFIGQMDAKIGEDGGRELLSRLTNIAQTGYEDISFKRASEALKDALKNHVGTDKTSTRPLDRITLRLSELNSTRGQLLEKIALLNETKGCLDRAEIAKKGLGKREAFLRSLKELLRFYLELERCVSLKTGLEQALEGIDGYEKELGSVSLRMEEYNRIIAGSSGIHAFGNDDMDRLDEDYNSLLGIEAVIRTLNREIDRKRQDDESGMINSGDIITPRDEIESIEKGKNKGSEAINEKIRNMQSGQRVYAIVMGVLTALSAMCFAAGLIKDSAAAAVVAGFVLLVCAVAAFFVRSKGAGELRRLREQKRAALINESRLSEDINKKRELLKLDLTRLEEELQENVRIRQALKNKIEAVLNCGGITGECGEQLSQEGIKAFRSLVRKYSEAKSEMGYALKRGNELRRGLDTYLKNASALCGEDVNSRQSIESKILSASERINCLEKKAEETSAEVEQLFLHEAVSDLYAGIYNDFKVLKSTGADMGAEGLEELLEREHVKTSRQLEEASLSIREYETIIKGIEEAAPDVQNIGAEIEELEAQKSKLEDINASLKIAADVLAEASMELQRDFAPALNKKLGDTISRITAGKYIDLRADNSLLLKAIVPETGEVVPVVALSGGTMDQMYLALRISVAQLIARDGENVPFIMDEVFAQYDDKRTEEAFDFLYELSQGRQVLLFTCKSREVELARQICGEINVIEL